MASKGSKPIRGPSPQAKGKVNKVEMQVDDELIVSNPNPEGGPMTDEEIFPLCWGRRLRIRAVTSAGESSQSPSNGKRDR
jgi:hypothetical protein